MKRIKHMNPKRGNECLHVETPLAIVNIRVGLNDADGRRVDAVEVIPGPDYVRGTRHYLDGTVNTRIVEGGAPPHEMDVAHEALHLKGAWRTEPPQLVFDELLKMRPLRAAAVALTVAALFREDGDLAGEADFVRAVERHVRGK